MVDKYEKTSVEKRFLYGDTKKPGTFFVDIFYSSIGRIIFFIKIGISGNSHIRFRCSNSGKKSDGYQGDQHDGTDKR